jgi:hypothetical protein
MPEEVMKIVDACMNFLYEIDTMADEVVLISLQHKKREGKALKVKLTRSVTVRGVNLADAHSRLKETFEEELSGGDVGVYERPNEKVLCQIQHYQRDPESKTLKYVSSKSMTIPNLGIDPVLRRIKAAFSRKK